MGLVEREKLSPVTLTILDEALRCGEGTGFRIPFRTVAGCEEVEVIVRAKMARRLFPGDPMGPWFR